MTFSYEQIWRYASEGWIENHRLDNLAASRPLTWIEGNEQTVAVLKLILFGPTAIVMFLDRILTRR